jgi:hypothetical protein
LGVIDLVAGSCCIQNELMLRDILSEELSDSFANRRRVFLKREHSVATSREMFGLPALWKWSSDVCRLDTAIIAYELSLHDVGEPDPGALASA